MLHDPTSQLMDMLMYTLSQGRICVVDVSQMRGAQALILSGLILRRIFDRNQQEFTEATPKTIPTIAVIEEAQSVLNESATSAEPYIAWVKEGRKYDLGALLITQQPGSIPVEILSQGDNWFIFHLLSSSDLAAVSKANAHFSSDLLSTLLNEPIPGQGVFWSSVGGKPYPVAVRVLSFEKLYSVRDPERNRPAGNTFLSALREACPILVPSPTPMEPSSQPGGSPPPANDNQQEQSPVGDAISAIEGKAVEALRLDEALKSRVGKEGVLWKDLNIFIVQKAVPKNTDNAWDLAYSLVPKMLNAVFGEQGTGWHSFRNDAGKTCVKRGPEPK